MQRAACSVQRAACSVHVACNVQRSVQRAACSVQRAACSVQCVIQLISIYHTSELRCSLKSKNRELKTSYNAFRDCRVYFSQSSCTKLFKKFLRLYVQSLKDELKTKHFRLKSLLMPFRSKTFGF